MRNNNSNLKKYRAKKTNIREKEKTKRDGRDNRRGFNMEKERKTRWRLREIARKEEKEGRRA